MATPFSPFVGRLPKPKINRRQSELPSDLIDWDAPEMPELEKQKIIYEDYIKEITEDQEIESLLNEQIFQIAHDCVVAEYQTKLKSTEDEVAKERSRVHLLLSQIKMFENNVKENEERQEELENELVTLRNAINTLEQEKERDKENWLEEKNGFQAEIENLNFRNNETHCELNQYLDMYIQKKKEAEDNKMKLDAVKSQLTFYKRLAKNKENVETD